MSLTLIHAIIPTSVGIVTGYALDGRGSVPSTGKRFFSFPLSKPALKPIQLPIHWGLGALSLGTKQLGCEANRSLQSSAKVKKGEAIPPLPHIFSQFSS
jgi:hypothetical protein